MLQRLLFVFFFCSISGPVFAAPTFLADGTQYDFGTIAQGEGLDYRFRFQNSGDDILEIGQIRSSCGCTAALPSSRRLAPGEVGELNVHFNSSGFRGQVHKTIEVETNDPLQPIIVFDISGQVRSQLYCEPERISWGLVDGNSSLQRTLTLYNDSDRRVTLTAVKVIGQGVSVSAAPEGIEPGASVELTVSGQLSEQAKRLAGYVVILTDSPAVPQLRIPVSARRKN